MSDEIILKKIQELESNIQSMRTILVQVKHYLGSINKRITDMEKKERNK